MKTITTPPITVPAAPEKLFAFLSDLRNHKAFMEPEAADWTADQDTCSYRLEVMGMKVPLDLKVVERQAATLVALAPNGRKLFDHTLRFEIGAEGEGSTLRIVDQADIPMMMAMMGAEKLVAAELEQASQRIRDLAAAGQV